MAQSRNKSTLTAVTLFGVAGIMVGAAYAAVPLYQLFCQVTGYGGTPSINTARSAETTQPGKQKTGREITVRLDANVSSTLPWSFKPERKEVKIRVGETGLATYIARNQSDRAITGTATFNVTPYKAGPYFSKVACFCFTEQKLEAGEEISMAVSFYVDPDIFDDPNTKEVNTITLSYTFFRAVKEAEKVSRVSMPDSKTGVRRNDG